MNRLQWLTVALVAATASTAALAQDNTMAPAQSKRMKLDANNDGVIDRAEAGKHERLAAKFDQLDKNGDGRLTADERPQRSGKQGKRGMDGHHGGMMKADANKDGNITRAEAAANPKLAAKFDKLDGNRDGVVDRADMQARMLERKNAWFASADSNQDGRLSQAEMEGATAKRQAKHPQKAQKHTAAERFQKLDRNNDGSISREELQSRRQR